MCVGAGVCAALGREGHPQGVVVGIVAAAGWHNAGMMRAGNLVAAHVCFTPALVEFNGGVRVAGEGRAVVCGRLLL